MAALQDHCPAGSQLVAAPVASTVPGRGAASALVDLGACQFSQFVQSAYHHEANDNAPYRPQFLRMMPCEGVASRGLTLLGHRTSRCRGLTFRSCLDFPFPPVTGKQRPRRLGDGSS